MNIPKIYSDNRYYRNNPDYFNQLRLLIMKYPRQCTKIILAKGRKRENNKQKLKYLYDWIMQMTQQFIEIPPTLIEICAWIMNDMIDYKKCKNSNCIRKVKKYQSTGKYGEYCCHACSASDPQTLIKRENNCLQKYGAKNVFASEYGKNKMKETCLKKYGVPYSGMTDIKKQNTEKSNLKKYGVKNVNQIPEIKQRGTDTLMTKYGQLFNYSKYSYDDLKFDSSWELIYYIYLKSNNIQFEFHKPHFWIPYNKNRKTCRYYPDFIVGKEIHEIKGDQFFNANGEPFDRIHRVWWREKYECMLKNNVKIITGKEIKPILKWFYSIYSNEYIAQFLISKTK